MDGLGAPRQTLQHLHQNARPQDPRSQSCAEKGRTEEHHKWREPSRPAIISPSVFEWASSSGQWTWAAATSTRPRTSNLRQFFGERPTAVPTAAAAELWAPASSSSTSNEWAASAPSCSPATTPPAAAPDVQQHSPATPSRSSDLPTIRFQLSSPSTPSTCCASTPYGIAPASSASPFPDELQPSSDRYSCQSPAASATSSYAHAFREVSDGRSRNQAAED